MISRLLFAVMMSVTLALPAGAASRIKDIAVLQAARDNQLVGYGLVIGLQGSGDSLRNSPFTEQSMRAMLENLGIASEGVRSRAKNVAAVIITANLPPFVQSGARIDVNVSSLGDATSLAGGTLVMTPLRAADGEIYAVAQGSVIVSGFNAQGQAETLTQGVPTSGRVPSGAIIERKVEASMSDSATLVLQLRNADFSTAVRVADAINSYTGPRFGAQLAKEEDARTIRIRRPKGVSYARFYAEIENLMVESDGPARVVVDERSGTVVIGNDVRISRVAISHGALTVRITETPRVVQPEPFSRGQTAVEPFTEIEATQPDARVAVLDGPNLQTLVSGLNRLGVKPDGIIAILQGIKSAGALQAELVLQ
ncbi:flagellar basal body P-ring protein FlgI [Nitratireductor aquimarinus]|uniref:flagellar basal body P-ring protein FlgI n=2 Tax=Alphaproteobacteria TaxID=28211 RepID=UPI000DDEAD14|nr:flagellar basal body P-ring protein FlgI [Tritonibacter mobilis]MBN7756729.1 flagellar basal body P-ring protein FlgI [Nitratireductor aquimarinus]MBN7761910.1 flagellar basal body P-ring protein FlgI [Nitratireductor aquibiodomus]MBN7775174.1 flagellar basal body P-ring protein FlgI [Nitratireductor pacificus]MBY6021680.1 flagellar basal body P-ring protein FlgI [Nitratireductor sp. DP7N14-4]MCV0351928.1 flagellar basal body P-ring protein FlgI [Nitratireductor sp.]